MSVTLFRKPGCTQCDATERGFGDRVIPVEAIERNLVEDDDALARVLELGFQQAPVVLIEEGDEIVDAWSGYRPDKINEHFGPRKRIDG